MRKSLTFNNQRKDWLYLLRGRRKSPFAPIQRELVSVPGMNGAHLSGSRTEVMRIEQPIGFVVKDDEHALQIKDELAEWLVTNEPVPLTFDDEPNRTYYAVIEGTIDDFDRFVNQRSGVITFLLPDPYGYGKEKTYELPSDIEMIENNGTAPSDPIFELEAKEKSTFAMVSSGEDDRSMYNIVGQIADDDIEVVDTRTSVLYENGSTIDTWEKATMDMVDDPNVSNIDGVMGTDGAGIRPDNYGPSGSGQRGPAVFKEIDPIQDFELETTFDIISRREIENFRMMIYLHDENMNPIGEVGIKDNSRTYKRRVPLAVAGPRSNTYGQGRIAGDQSDYTNNARDTTLFYLRVKREGQKFSFYIGEWQSQRHIRKWEGTFRDIDNKYQGKLKYVTLFIGSYQDRVRPSRLRINSVEVFELSQTEEDQTPYIIYPGDIITFDHKDEDILINGEPRNDLKNFGGSFFTLEKGLNTIVVTPEDTFETRVSFRERFR